MRPRVAVPALVAGLLAVSVAAVPAGPARAEGVPGAFALTGAGFGHGVGMSQYGALAMAKEGRDAAAIVTHYYPGTQVVPVRDDMDIRVNVEYREPLVRFRPEALAPDGGRAEVALGGTVVPVGPGEVVTFRPVPGGVAATRRAGGADTELGSAPSAVIRWAGTRTPGGAAGGPTLANVTSGSLESSGHRFRWGVMEVLPAQGGATLNAVNVLRLHDEYLHGISEVSSSWPDAALQAQVLAARTYALAKLAMGVRAACDCHVDDGRGPYTDQTFTGWSKASAPMGERWVAAVAATHPDPVSGLAILFGGQPIQAFYQSSTGGFTTPVRELWGGDLPYAASVPDPWSLTADNPNRAWSVTVSQTAAASAFGLPQVARLQVTERYTGGAVRRLTATAPDGTSRTISGSAMQRAFGLKSLYVNAVDGDPGVPVPQQQAPAAPAAPADPNAPAPQPSVPAADPVPVQLAVRIGPTTTPRAGRPVTFRGTVTPAARGLRIERQMLQPDGTWKVMARDRTDARGRFAFRIKKAVPAGASHTYRLVAFRGDQQVGESEQAVIAIRPRRG